ncbi:MAG: Fe-S cluster assembly ATPase SufC [Coriobacteriia bacterium]|nr:Fe-S cluster assembly ATPase SufC [Coriobacteriia bacterium]
MSCLVELKNVSVNVEDKQILNGVDLCINPGEVHVIMGPNGAGKSTLANAIMAHPKYTLTQGDILFEGESIVELSADERARKGIFLSFQTPIEVPGITVEEFLRTTKAQVSDEKISILKFKKSLMPHLKDLDLDEEYLDRYLNVGFSGGEKKKTEILQMKVLDPKFIMLDEADSGLDVDAVRIVSENVAKFMDETKSLLIITHHSEILTSIEPDFVHVIMNGKLVKSGNAALGERIQKEGFNFIREELGLKPVEEESSAQEA